MGYAILENMKYFSDATRAKMSESAKRRATTPKFLEQIYAYWKPICSYEELHRMYVTEQMSQMEIAGLLGVTLKRVQTSLRRYGIQSRPARKRNQQREHNDSWKGDDASYAAFHYRIKALRGSPKRCEECGTTDHLKTYDWANMTGKYEDPSDYKRTCRSCHFKHDKLYRNFKGATGGRVDPKEVSICPKD
jgi:hypothetical protein